jgi:IS66 Orf2 like protein
MMVSSGRRQRIWLARHRVDFRKAHNGLLAEAYKMNLDPFGGDVIIFIGRNRRRLKVLYADPTGMWVSSKVFTVEAMKTKLSFLLEPSCESITSAELAMLCEGSRYTLQKKVTTYAKPVDQARPAS